MPVAKKERKCPEGKELKPSTGRCVKKCKPNRVRDPATFKCIKNPKNHIVNPITGRQVKRGYYHGIEKAQARILQAIVRRKITKGKPSSGTPEQYKRMSPAARSSMSSSSQSSSSSSASASASPKSNSSSLLGSPSRSTRMSLSTSHSSQGSPVLTPHMPFIPPKPKKSSSSSSSASSASSRSASRSPEAAAAAYSVSSPKHTFKFMDGKRKGDIVKIKRQR